MHRLLFCFVCFSFDIVSGVSLFATRSVVVYTVTYVATVAVYVVVVVLTAVVIASVVTRVVRTVTTMLGSPVLLFCVAALFMFQPLSSLSLLTSVFMLLLMLLLLLLDIFLLHLTLL